MKDQDTIHSTSLPNTRTSLGSELKKLGVKEGMVLIVHSSLSSLGWVCGGSVAVVQALMDVLGEKGTLVMPTQTADNSDPAGWGNPPVPEAWWETIREEMPAYNTKITPTRGMGKIVEAFRTFPGVKRSPHPMYSFAAWGKEADFIIEDQQLEQGFGPSSPLERIYQLGGYVLLIGVGHDNNTSLHYAEHAVPNRELQSKGSALIENGKRVWKTYDEIVYDSDPFEQLGRDYEKEGRVTIEKIGKAECRLMSQPDLVDFAKSWLIDFNK
jgi:aminoglycoside 3-N-acetyltransferase